VKPTPLDDLVLLPESSALERHFDAKSWRTLRWLLPVVCIPLTVAFFVSLHSGFVLGAAVYGLDLVTSVTLLVLRRREVFARLFRQVLLGWLLLQVLALKVASMESDVIPLFVVAGLALLFFRMRIFEHLLVFGAYWVAAVLPLGWLGLLPAGAEETPALAAAVTPFAILCGAGAIGLSQLERRRFLADWRREALRARERLRMKEEIDTARRIQLSMLPQAAPATAWLDLSSVSLPATEVGGDYYDWFVLGPGRVALVVGDVAGHGLASGLLLSGVRSCLYLLEEDLADTAAVFHRLDRMVRRTTARRTFMTLLCAVLDREAGALSVCAAGHPPLLLRSARTGGYEPVGNGAPPLGTPLDSRYAEERRPLAPGDLLLLYTDGLVESRSGRGEEYGEERLRRAVDRAAGLRSAREIRDAVLGDLSSFKAGGEQADDITLVVARVR
jgi:serine phosphatase RsbU (regulator of sigma subunit)